jgi:hypothetical protein
MRERASTNRRASCTLENSGMAKSTSARRKTSRWSAPLHDGGERDTFPDTYLKIPTRFFKTS